MFKAAEFVVPSTLEPGNGRKKTFFKMQSHVDSHPKTVCESWPQVALRTQIMAPYIHIAFHA